MNRTHRKPMKGMLRTTMLAGWALFAVSCNHHRNDPGWAYMADFDMYYSKPYDAYTANPVFADSLTMQATPEGSIPRGHMPYPYLPKSMDEQVRAGKELLNPLEPTRADLLEGREQYLIYCSSCHGERGDGKGHLYTSKRFPAAPTSLIEAYVQNKPDGEIYHVITRGSVSGLMGPLASQVRPGNRWKIISYVRELGKK